MPAAQRVGDQNTGGGVAQGGVKSVRINNLPVIVTGNNVTPHAKHKNVKTSGGSKTVKAGGKPIIRTGDKDTCGHARADGSPNVRVG